MTYQVEVRDLNERSFSCTCPDFRTAGLATCKHVEATLIWLKRRHKGEFRLAKNSESPRIDVVPDGDTLRIERTLSILPAAEAVPAPLDHRVSMRRECDRRFVPSVFVVHPFSSESSSCFLLRRNPGGGDESRGHLASNSSLTEESTSISAAASTTLPATVNEGRNHRLN